jgi:polyphosphate kinase 2 (PPK2 family)
MLETLDLTLKLGKTKYRDAMSLLAYDLQALQRAAFEHGVPVVVVLEGLESAGKGDSIAHLVEHMDPRGFKVHGIRRATEEEAMRPMLWRFWRRLPPQGGIAIFDRSWYSILVDDRLDRKLSRRAWEQELEEVNAFERQLIDEGTLILKLWLHISRKEQKRRFKAWARDESQRWRVQEDNLKKHRLYDDYLRHAEDLLARSHTHGAPWHLVAAEEERYRRVKVLGIFAEELRRLLEGRGIKIPDAEQFRRDTP